MTTFALVILAAALVGLVATVHRAAALLLGLIQELAQDLGRIADGPEVPFSTRLADVEDQIERLPQRWEEFKNEARRAEGRARSIVADARKELEGLGFEHPGVEAQASELRIIDGGGSREEPVPTVHESVEGPADTPSDWRSAALRRKFYGQ